MTRQWIDSLDDPRLEPYRHLKHTNATRWTNTFVAEGEKLTRRLLASDFPVLSVLVDTRHEALLTPLVPPEVPLYVVPDRLVEELVGFNFHRGVLAHGGRKPALSLEELASGPRGVGFQPAMKLLGDRQAGSLSHVTLVVCPDVQDPENLGSIARIGSSFGVDGLLLGPSCCPPFSRRVLRVSMGAVWRVPIVECRDLAADLQRLRELGVELVATVLDAAAEPLRAVHRPARMAILFGNEGQGLSRELIEQCDRRVTIPMHPGTDSLNVAVAAGIMLYHFCADSGEQNHEEGRIIG